MANCFRAGVIGMSTFWRNKCQYFLVSLSVSWMSPDCEHTTRENVTLGFDTLTILNIFWHSVGNNTSISRETSCLIDSTNKGSKSIENETSASMLKHCQIKVVKLLLRRGKEKWSCDSLRYSCKSRNYGKQKVSCSAQTLSAGGWRCCLAPCNTTVILYHQMYWSHI